MAQLWCYLVCIGFPFTYQWSFNYAPSSACRGNFFMCLQWLTRCFAHEYRKGFGEVSFVVFPFVLFYKGVTDTEEYNRGHMQIYPIQIGLSM